MSLIVSHPTGAPFVRAVLKATERAGLLEAFHTTLALPPTLAKTLPRRFAREASRRTFAEAPRAKVVSHPRREALRLLGRRFRSLPRVSVDDVYRDLDRAVAAAIGQTKKPPAAVYAYEDGALETFRAAQRCGALRLYDLPIAHWQTHRRVLEEEREHRPDWAPTMTALTDGPEKLAAKDAEIEAAEIIFVASSFTRASVEARFGTDRTVVVIPYGAPPPRVWRPAPRKRDAPLHVFFAGHLNQRKGIADLMEALENLAVPWRLTLAGRIPSGAPAALTAFLDRENVTHLGHVPHPTLLEAMVSAHVFVFPSLIEGFAMVLTEAMACAMPIITTPHTAGPDLISEGVEGHIVPIRAPDVITERLTALYADEPARQAMGKAALVRARSMPWRTYEEAMAAAIAARIGRA